jgi:UDP-glucose 4-epimerase
MELDFSKKKVLVTGGAGFVGSNIVERLLNLNVEKVIVLDNLFTGSLENLPEHKNLKFIKGSVEDRKLVSELVSQVPIIIHEAARNIIVSTKNPYEDYETNIGGTLNVLMAAKDNPGKRVVYASSASVYGNPRFLPIMEDEQTLTFSPYSVSKLAGENYCRAFYETYEVSVSIVRYSNVYGPKQNPQNPYCGVISKFIESIMRGKLPVIHGDGRQTRDFTYVSDAVEATLLCAISPKAEGMVFNVGTGIETDLLEVVEILGNIFGKKITPKHVDRRDIDNIRRRVLNIERLRTRLRWVPQITLEDGLKRTVEWLMHEKSIPSKKQKTKK